MLGNQTLRCASGVDAGDTCLSDAQIAGYNVTNTAWTLNYELASGGRRTRALTSGTDFGNPGTSPLQPTVPTLSLSTEQSANPMPAVKLATTTTIATSLRVMDHATVLAAHPHRHGCGQGRQFCPLL